MPREVFRSVRKPGVYGPRRGQKKHKRDLASKSSLKWHCIFSLDVSACLLRCPSCPSQIQMSSLFVKPLCFSFKRYWSHLASTGSHRHLSAIIDIAVRRSQFEPQGAGVILQDALLGRWLHSLEPDHPILNAFVANALFSTLFRKYLP